MDVNISPSEFVDLRTKCDLAQHELAAMLGVSRNYVSMLERGAKKVSEATPIGVLFRIRQRELESKGKLRLVPVVAEAELGNDPPSPRVTPPYSPYEAEQRSRRNLRTIKLIGWAHAGKAASYEELPHDWQELVPTDCPDMDAFAVTLEGPSQEPLFHDGDRLTLMPHAEVWSGCQCVIRLKDDGVLCRRVEIRGQTVRLHPENKDWETEEIPRENILWMYRIWGSWTQVFR